MRKHLHQIAVVGTLGAVAAVVAGIGIHSRFRDAILLAHSDRFASGSPYHSAPPTKPLAKTLDPAQFADNPTAYVAYSLAAKIPDILYQIPCACPCHRTEQHQSLYDCFRTNHGIDCSACKKEVIFCFEARKRGMGVAAIRKEIQDYRWTTVDMERYAKAYPNVHNNSSQ
jgi:hypothetical protein